MLACSPKSIRPLQREQQKEGNRNHHWDSQASVLQTQHFHFSRISKIETEREKCFEQVFGRMGFDPNWVKLKLDQPINPSSAEPAKLITQEDMKKIHGIFKHDFSFFGYDDAIPESLRAYF